MDFEKVLEKILDDFRKEKVNYAVIGGFALGVWGVIRATADLDLLVKKDDSAKVKNIMESYEYKCVHEDENVAQFSSKKDILGSIDFLYSFRQPSREMLRRCVSKKVFEQKLTINVLIPEDLIGLKIQAIVNDPQRKSLDWQDIERLIEKNLDSLNWDIIENHFKLFGLNNEFKELKTKYE